MDTRADLDAWQEHFDMLGVVHTPVVDRHDGSVLTFKDPDGIQFGMVHRADHPRARSGRASAMTRAVRTECASLTQWPLP